MGRGVSPGITIVVPATLLLGSPSKCPLRSPVPPLTLESSQSLPFCIPRACNLTHGRPCRRSRSLPTSGRLPSCWAAGPESASGPRAACCVWHTGTSICWAQGMGCGDALFPRVSGPGSAPLALHWPLFLGQARTILASLGQPQGLYTSFATSSVLPFSVPSFLSVA